MAKATHKLKTRKSVSKRFKLTGTGKITRMKTGLNHLMLNKSPGQRRNLLRDGLLAKGDTRRIKRMLGDSI